MNYTSYDESYDITGQVVLYQFKSFPRYQASKSLSQVTSMKTLQSQLKREKTVRLGEEKNAEKRGDSMSWYSKITNSNLHTCEGGDGRARGRATTDDPTPLIPRN